MPNQRVGVLTPDQAMHRMRWSRDRDDIFVLNGGIEKRMSTLSQQVRAISLIGALIDHGRVIPSETKLMIIGGGVAGLTAAAVALSRGCKHIQGFEKGPSHVSTFAASGRLVDPRLYEWPLADWKIERAQLSLLDWKQAQGSLITSIFRHQWAGWWRLFGENALRRIDWQFNQDVRPEQVLEHTDPKTVKIVAVGFGEPHRLPRVPNAPDWVVNYWRTPPSPANEGERIGVIGAQDGGLTEAIEHALRHVETQANYDPEKPWITQADLRGFLNEFEKLMGDDMQRLAADLFKGDDEILDVPNRPARQYEAHFASLGQLGAAEFDRTLARVGFRLRTGPKVAIFLRTDAPGSPPVVRPEAFLLNRWLAAQLVRHQVIELHACPGNFLDTIEEQSSRYTIQTWSGSQTVDRLFARTGPQPVTGWEGFMQEFRDSARERAEDDKLWKGHLMYPIARRPPQVGDPKRTGFYSDLFDSPVQRAALEALLEEHAGAIEDAENELVELYERRLNLERKQRNFLLFSDNQVIDGAFFLRWLPRLTPEQLNDLAGFLRIGVRKSRQPSNGGMKHVLDDFVCGAGNAKEVELSAIYDRAARDEVRRHLGAKDPLTGIDGVRDYLEAHDASPEALSAWAALSALHEGICQLDLSALSRTVNFAERPMDHAPALEDPGKFAENYPNSNAVVEYAFPQQRPRPRSEVYAYIDRQDARERESVRDWYDRGYARSIAFQQASANELSPIFETVRVEGLPLFNRRDGRENSRQLLPGRAPSLRGRGGAGASSTATLGKRALALLRGAPTLARLWTEEANEVGARVPAVIDEELASDGETRLNRVEYFEDIARDA